MDTLPRSLTRPLLALVGIIAVGVVQWALGSALEETRQVFGWRWAEVGAAAMSAIGPAVHFFIAAAGLFVIGWIVQTLLGSASVPLAAAGAASQPIPDLGAQPPDRVFLPPGIEPRQLIAPFKEHTNLHAKKISEAYIGKWMARQGRLRELTKLHKGFGAFLADTMGAPDVRVFFLFDDAWKDKLEVIPIGHTIRIVGKISDINAMTVQLSNCELL